MLVLALSMVLKYYLGSGGGGLFVTIRTPMRLVALRHHGRDEPGKMNAEVYHKNAEQAIKHETINPRSPFATD